MKKSIFFVAVVATAFAMTGCKSSESAYRKAYEKAKAQQSAVVETQPQQQEVVAVQPVVSTPVTPQRQDDSNVSVRQENLTVVSGNGLKAYSVVVGSFGVKANAEGLQQTLKNQGYAAQIAFNAERKMYRVVASTFDTKSEAISSRSSLNAKYPDAWLLYNK